MGARAGRVFAGVERAARCTLAPVPPASGAAVLPDYLQPRRRPVPLPVHEDGAVLAALFLRAHSLPQVRMVSHREPREALLVHDVNHLCRRVLPDTPLLVSLCLPAVAVVTHDVQPAAMPVLFLYGHDGPMASAGVLLSECSLLGSPAAGCAKMRFRRSTSPTVTWGSSGSASRSSPRSITH